MENQIFQLATDYSNKIDYSLWLDSEHPESRVKMLVMATYEDGINKGIELIAGKQWISAKTRMPKIGETVLWKGYKNIQEVTDVVITCTKQMIKENGDRQYMIIL